MSTVRKIIHIDMDAFFAAVEQRDFPEYRNKPLIVGGNPFSRGVVATCNYEARQFGIHSAMPTSRAYRLCPQAIFVKPRFEAYREASQAIRQIFLITPTWLSRFHWMKRIWMSLNLRKTMAQQH